MKGLILSLSVIRHSEQDLEHIKRILSNHSGNTDVHIRFSGSKGRSALVSLGDPYKVRLTEKLRGEISRWIDTV